MPSDPVQPRQRHPIPAPRLLLQLLLVALASVAPSMAAATGNAYLTATIQLPPPSGAKALCRQYSWACEGSNSANLTYPQEWRLIRTINANVNARTRSISDQSQYNRAELWALPTQRGGDCEDFALLKKRELIRRGVDPRKLLLATVLDRRRNAHAVLVYRSENGDLVLDNLTNKIRSWKDTRYLFLRMQNPQLPSAWVGGFKTG
ncbi:transglutaminase-like cysteine peptidase [Parasedimentitalea psychrophila]|uniref:Transglutaminase-like cysteine peptidase n=1 Tax=Parasedimentitalea psychrophila TaxID=2997337 RepID=A0A9Y2L2E6_9RHOB|nr:transglutaminase-like cysteine peptidase [Parasedimentitalea psychrophila]WIY27073.1 transglutaminase-like cysteine peptidase [Parasedimentitalea psychrophila]